MAMVLAGARIVEFVAKKHYERARNFAVQGFEYLAEEDQYRCPEGEHLKLLKRDNENRLAVYQISTSCQFCRLKESCTPHSGRGGKIPPAHQRDYVSRCHARLRPLPTIMGWQARHGPLRNRAGRECRFSGPRNPGTSRIPRARGRKGWPSRQIDFKTPGDTALGDVRHGNQ